MSPNGRMCALDSPLPPFPTNPLSQHRNALCAHGCVFVSFPQHGVCFLRNTGARAGPTKVWALWTQDNRGLMAAIVPRPCAVCIKTPSPSAPNALLVFTSFTGVSPAPHGAFSLMTHLVAPLCVPGRPRVHGQGQLSQHRGCPK